MMYKRVEVAIHVINMVTSINALSYCPTAVLLYGYQCNFIRLFESITLI